MAEAAKQEPVITMWSKEFTYDRWMKSKGIPIHTGYLHRRSAHRRVGMVGGAGLQGRVHSTHGSRRR